MKLFRFRRSSDVSQATWPLAFQKRGAPGVVLGNKHLDVSAWGADFDRRFFDAGWAGFEAWLSDHAAECPVLDPEAVHFCEAVVEPSKIVAVGLNYRSHASETGSEVPREPKLFMKAVTALAGVSDEVLLPPGSVELDYEVELAVVIGRVTRHVSAADARQSIFGYAMMNDYSEREYQKKREGQWVKGKSYDTFAPLGPYLVPAAFLDPGDLELSLRVNGELRQQSRTSNMVFNVFEIVHSVSQYMTLLPGDIITTGTPAGVGVGYLPPRFLRAGDRVEYEISGLGSALQIVTERAPGL
jgi:2,4-didehydro-3-deoxy-L-rhamnonate hydrolase